MEKNLKALFIIRAAEHFSRYQGIIQAWCMRGHRLIILFDEAWSSEDDMNKVSQFKSSVPNLEHYWLINRNDVWTSLLFTVRSLLTYRRFLVIEHQSSFFKDRWRSYLPFWLRVPLSFGAADWALKTAAAHFILTFLENLVPADRSIVAQVKNYHPDIVISPVGGIRVLSPNTEYLKAAKALGVPTASPLVSWDSLTTKSFISIKPDLFLAWNEVHKAEAMEHHYIPPASIKIIGAPVFDKWFSNLAPSMDRSEFCELLGLVKEQPYLLYLGSAKGTAKDETWLIRALRKTLDESHDRALGNIQIVVRPHPANAGIYKDFEVPGVSVFPRKGALPDTRESLQLSFESYYHATAVIGIFTSAMMEALIVGKPVIVILSKEYEKTQGEAEHFRHFVDGGAVTLVSSIEAALGAVRNILEGRDDLAEKRKGFVRKYIRPRGLTTDASEAAVDEIEHLVGR